MMSVMKAEPLTTVQLFEASARYLIPMFQRPYVWTEKDQWEPLWQDVRAVAERVLTVGPFGQVPAHFLGAVVLEPIVQLGVFHSQWSVIDGQQRLTTLQVLLDACEVVVRQHGDPRDADALRWLVVNQGMPDDSDARFKVWPTNRDRDGFAAAMDDARPVPSAVADSRIVAAHEFFVQQVRAWALADGTDKSTARLHALVVGLRDRLSVVGIQLEPGDNAQVIFETLNFRGAPLLAADLVKNHLFQRAERENRDTEKLYDKFWSELDDDYWRERVVQGRLTRPRIDIFLSRWMVMRLGREVASDQIFADFKDHVSAQYDLVDALLRELHHDALTYRAFLAAPVGSEHERIRYHVLDVLNSNVVMPVILWFLTRSDDEVPSAQKSKGLRALDSYVTRRAILKLGTKDLNHVVIEMLNRLGSVDPMHSGDELEAFLLGLTGVSRVWPDDEYLVDQLPRMRTYRVLRRDVTRMLLEAAEDRERARRDVEDQHCPRNLSVEHVMPQSWTTHWPLASDDPAEISRRDDLVQTLGNLTLVKGNHNSALSNNAWTSSDGKSKREYLKAHTSLFMNQQIRDSAVDAWTEEHIEERGLRLARDISARWPRPSGGPRTSEMLRLTTKNPEPASHSQYACTLTGPTWQEEGLPRRRAVRTLIARMHADGVPMADICDALQTSRIRSVPGTLTGEELWNALKWDARLAEEQRRLWAVEDPIHEGGATWVVSKSWGLAAEKAMDVLTALRPGYSAQTQGRAKARWDVEDVFDALADRPELVGALETMIQHAESLGGRAQGTAAAAPSLAIGVPTEKGMAWPYTVYTGNPERALYLYFGTVGAPVEAREAFLTRLEAVLPELDGDEIRDSGMAKQPALTAGDLTRSGVATGMGEALAALAAESSGEQRWWGIHNDALPGSELLAGGFVSVGWDLVPDLRQLGGNRQDIEDALRAAYPEESDGAYVNWASILRKFAFDMKPGDLVIAADKQTRTLSIGRVSGPYWFDSSADRHKHRLPIEWLTSSLARAQFTQSALHEVGSALTLFRVRRHVNEFEQALGEGAR